MLRIVARSVELLIALPLFDSFTIVVPGETSVRQFLGRYIGTVRHTGLVLVPPLTTGRRVSIKVHNFETNELKVNDLDGNPVNIAAILERTGAQDGDIIFFGADRAKVVNDAIGALLGVQFSGQGDFMLSVNVAVFSFVLVGCLPE